MSEIEETEERPRPGYWYWNVDLSQFLFGIDVGPSYIDICFGPFVITRGRKQK